MSVKWCEANLMIWYVCDLNYITSTILLKLELFFRDLTPGFKRKYGTIERECWHVTWLPFATMETRGRLDRVNFRKDFWDCYWRQAKKNWPIADRHVTSNNPRKNCGMHFGSSSHLVSNIARSKRLLLYLFVHCFRFRLSNQHHQWFL